MPRSANQLHGAMFTILSCIAYATTDALAFQAMRLEKLSSPMIASFIRAIITLLAIILLAHRRKKLRVTIMIKKPILYLRGLVGSLSLMCIYPAVERIGLGESSFLVGMDGLFVAVFSIFILREKVPIITWIAIFLSIIGLYLVLSPKPEESDIIGKLFALGAGILGALSYTIIAHAKEKFHTEQLVFAGAFVGAIIHIIVFLLSPVSFPKNTNTYIFLLASGVSAAIAAYAVTAAYQLSRASLNAAIGYLSPVLKFTFAVIIFDASLSTESMIGIGLIFVSSLLLPLWREWHCHRKEFQRQ